MTEQKRFCRKINRDSFAVVINDVWGIGNHGSFCPKPMWRL